MTKSEIEIPKSKTKNPKSDFALRDHFAGLAMQALITARASLPEQQEESFAYASVAGIGASVTLRDEDGYHYTWARLLCDEAYEIADAMIAAKEIDRVE